MKKVSFSSEFTFVKCLCACVIPWNPNLKTDWWQIILSWSKYHYDRSPFCVFCLRTFFCENIKSYIMNIIHARNIYSFYPIFRHSVNRDRVYYYVLLLAVITIEPWQTHENYWLKYEGFSSNIYGGVHIHVYMTYCLKWRCYHI